MNNQDIIQKFYTAFGTLSSADMISCYHEEIQFNDPVFGTLKGQEAKAMWQMLLERIDKNAKIEYRNIVSDGDTGSAEWFAEYEYGPKKRKVVNTVKATFKFKDGKIIEHTDDFDFWKWTKQALGLSGYLLGWSGFMRKKVQETTNAQLKKYVNSKN